MARVSKKFNFWIELIPNAMNAPDVIRCFRCNLEFAPEVTNMIIDCPTGVIIKIFVPYKVHDHIISEYPVRIHNEQSKDIEFLYR